MPTEPEDEFALVLPFDSDDPEFTRGVQVGMVYALTLPPEERPVTVLVGEDTAEMLVRLMEAGHRFTVADNGPGWLAVQVQP